MQELCRPVGRVIRSPLSDARVEGDDAGTGAHEVRERSEQKAAGDRDRECEGKSQSSRGARVESTP